MALKADDLVFDVAQRASRIYPRKGNAESLQQALKDASAKIVKAKR